jgi:putative hydrolase of the HAD superfamily
MPLRGLIFDFDGLIVDTESAIIESWQAIHREDGLPSRPDVLHALVGHVDVAADIWEAYPDDHDKSALDRRHRTLARALMAAAPVRPGVDALLAEARSAGLRLAVASNSSHAHVEGQLAPRGLLPLFDAVLCREDVPLGKPEPDLYLAALARLGLPASDVLAFEDSVPGHVAAARAGLRVIVTPNPATAHHEFPHALRRWDSLHSVTVLHLATLPALP